MDVEELLPLYSIPTNDYREKQHEPAISLHVWFMLLNQLHQLLLATDASRRLEIKASYSVNTTLVDQSHNPFAQSNTRQKCQKSPKFEESFLV